jgi:lipopolysaccharide biosynthesis regulator YciM
MNNPTETFYSEQHIYGLYNLARMFFTSGFDSKAEKICLGLLSISETNILARLLIAAIHLERGNYSLAANHYRIASQDNQYSLEARFGLLACYSGLMDTPRTEMLASELEKEKETFSEELKVLFDLFRRSLEVKKHEMGKKN